MLCLRVILLFWLISFPHKMEPIGAGCSHTEEESQIGRMINLAVWRAQLIYQQMHGFFPKCSPSVCYVNMYDGMGIVCHPDITS